MKQFILTGIALCGVWSSARGAPTPETRELRGSDTMGGVLTDVIRQVGLESSLRYVGGGSATAEKAVLDGTQALAPMSRELSSEALALAVQKGVRFTPHVIGLDAIVVLVNDRNRMQRLDFPTLARIYSCEITKWENVPGARAQGEIRVLARDEKSGTTELFRQKLGLKAFGPCVKALDSTKAVAEATVSDERAVGYSGLPAQAPGNHALALSSHPGLEGVKATVENVQNGRYPLARKLYVYEADGAVKPVASESRLLGALLDRAIVTPILQAHEFVPTKE